MSSMNATDRRRFLGGMMAAAAATTLPLARVKAAAAPQAGHDDWINEVRGSNKCLFDFPNHKMGFPLLHVFNYINTFSTAYGPGQIGTAGTFYGMGGASSIAMGFNDAMWAKYELGEYLGVKDASGTPYTRNVFNRPTKQDGHLFAAALQSPNFPLLGDIISACGIESLQGMGTKFIMCSNALGGWAFELEAHGKGAAADIDAELRQNLLPSVTIVPAMVIAIAKAQEAGISYNKQ